MLFRRPGFTSPSRVATSTSVVLCTVIAAAAHAGFTFDTISAPGGFIQACSGPSTLDPDVWPGCDFTKLFTDPGADVQEQEMPTLPWIPWYYLASATADYSNGNTTNGSVGAVGLGWTQLTAHNTAPNDSFAAANANAGWSETFLISNPELTGQPGYMRFDLHVGGTLFASGSGGVASFTVTGFKDSEQLDGYWLWDSGDSDWLGNEFQNGYWTVQSTVFRPTASKTVQSTVSFSALFYYGTEFKLGIYAAAKAGMGFNEDPQGFSTSEADFSGGLTWGGITYVTWGLQPVGGYTITTGSGIDWSEPVGIPINPDFNIDGVVDGADLGVMLGGWGTPAGDLNGDGTTDGADLGILLGAWS